MKYHIVLDTNVLVSALITKNPQSATVVLFARLIADENITLLLNDKILTEYHEVLHRPRFGLAPDIINPVLEKLESIGRIVKTTPYRKLMPDPKDIMFIEVSMAVPGSQIITGNLKHFPGIDNVMSPAEFLTLLDKTV